MDNALASMKVGEDEIDQVMLVGGGAQLFTIINHLRKRFGEGRVVLADNPEEIVAKGLGLEYGAAMEKIEPNILFTAGVVETVPEPAQGESCWKLIGADGKPVLLAAGVTKVGRGEGNDLCLEDVKVSRLHAELRVT
ncbi:MAG: hypothetical protein E4H27_08405, partial [Anaerolineales bacterium]